MSLRRVSRALRAAALPGAALVMAGSVAACGASGNASGGGSAAASVQWATKNLGVPASLVTQACKEGQVTYYSLPSPNLANLLAAFEKDVPCLHVNSYAAPGGEMTAKFKAEFSAHQYRADLMENSSPVFLAQLNQLGALARYTPATAGDVPANISEPGLWYPESGNVLAIVWNTKVVTPAQQQALENIQTWKDFLNVGGLQGKVVVIDIHGGGSDQLPWYFFNQQYGPSFATDFESKFKPQLSHGIIPSSEKLAAGGVSVIFAAVESITSGFYVKGAPLQWVYPKPYLLAPNFVADLSLAPDPAAAKLLETWLLSANGQETSVQQNQSAPLTTSIADNRAFTTKDWYHRPNLNDAYVPNWTAINNALPTLEPEFEHVFGG